ncbi:MAG: hypothetical protein OMM_13607, partial [Candidatus Magnetoglobus multicellularis str. Araruama]
MKKYVINTVRDIDMIQTARDEGLEKGFKDGKKIGREEGEKIGRKEGLKEGEIKGMIQMLLLNLKTRLGQLSEKIENQIYSISDIDIITDLVKLSCT